jgi:site-specific recombinase XerC
MGHRIVQEYKPDLLPKSSIKPSGIRGVWLFFVQKTCRNRAVIDVIGKGQRFRRIPLETKTLIAIQDYLKAAGNGTDPAIPLPDIGEAGRLPGKGSYPQIC